MYISLLMVSLLATAGLCIDILGLPPSHFIYSCNSCPHNRHRLCEKAVSFPTALHAMHDAIYFPTVRYICATPTSCESQQRSVPEDSRLDEARSFTKEWKQEGSDVMPISRQYIHTTYTRCCSDTPPGVLSDFLILLHVLFATR